MSTEAHPPLPRLTRQRQLILDRLAQAGEFLCAQQVYGVLRAGGEEDVLDRALQPSLGPVAVGDPLAQAGEALGVGVLEGVRARLGEHVVGGLLQPLDREVEPVGQAAGKADDRRVDGDLEDLADKGPGHVGDAVGKGVFHGVLSGPGRDRGRAV